MTNLFCKKVFTLLVKIEINLLYLQPKKHVAMIVKYDKDYLEELYDYGKCNEKKYRFQPQVVQKYQKRIDMLMAATRIEDLFVFKSLNFEKLEGTDRFSVRIDIHYRLEFKISQQEGETVLTICTIMDITNHYK